MRIVTRARLSAVLLMSWLAAPPTLMAEPIQISGGFLQAGVTSTNARFVLNGNGFFLDGFAEAFSSTLSLLCTPCAAGTTLDLGGSLAGPRAAARGVVDGVTYAEVFLDGITGTFSSPSFQITGTQAVIVSREFTFSGTVNGYLLDPFVNGFTEPVFTKTLFGRGTASATFLFNGADGALFSTDGVRYDFAADPAPVPEPATLLLFGTGAALAALRRRRTHL